MNTKQQFTECPKPNFCNQFNYTMKGKKHLPKPIKIIDIMSKALLVLIFLALFTLIIKHS